MRKLLQRLRPRRRRAAADEQIIALLTEQRDLLAHANALSEAQVTVFVDGRPVEQIIDDHLRRQMRSAARSLPRT
jgi:hypothetical protein